MRLLRRLVWLLFGSASLPSPPQISVFAPGMRVFAKDDYECMTVVKVLTPEEKRSFGQDVDLVLRDASGYECWLQFDDVTTTA